MTTGALWRQTTLLDNSVEYRYKRCRASFSPRLSVAGTLGIRNAADHGDYQAQSIATGVEVRYWFTGQALWNHKSVRNMVGPYASLRVSLQGTSTQMASESIGKTLTIGESVGAGYRFLTWRNIEVRLRCLLPCAAILISRDAFPHGIERPLASG